MSIQWKEKNICGAVLVNAKTALTAAHCCQLMESLVKQNEHWYDEILSKVTSRFSPLSLVAGEQTLSKEDGDEQVRHLFQSNNVIRSYSQCGNHDFTITQILPEINV